MVKNALQYEVFMTTICYDLDGVLRLLAEEAYGEEPPEWKYVNINGENIFDIIRKKPSILLEAKETELSRWLRNNEREITIITHQLPEWRELTLIWLHKYFPNNKLNVIYLHPLDKVKYVLKNNLYLIEDNPELSRFSRIVIYDKLYNRKFKAWYRIKNINDFLEFKKNVGG